MATSERQVIDADATLVTAPVKRDDRDVTVTFPTRAHVWAYDAKYGYRRGCWTDSGEFVRGYNRLNPMPEDFAPTAWQPAYTTGRGG
jgi:hypothetical protein